MSVFRHKPIIINDVHSRPSRHRSVVYSLFFLLVGLLMGLLTAELASAEGSVGYLEMNNNHLSAPHQALLLSTSVSAEVHGMNANTRLTQTFKNTSDQWLEGTYVFPLPENAAVYRITAIIGNRQIEATIKEKQQAQKIYQQAKQSGKLASFTQQQRPNLFTQAIANIPPHETVAVEITYQQSLSYQDGAVRLHFPTTYTPRYQPANKALSSAPSRSNTNTLNDSAAQVFSDDHSQFPTMSLDVQIQPGMDVARIESLHHPLSIESRADGFQITHNAPLLMDSDIAIHWWPKESASPTTSLSLQQPQNNLEDSPHFAELTILPPSSDDSAASVLPRELLFIIDTSGSMQGTSIQQAKASLIKALQFLRPGDFFNIIEFNNQTRQLFSESTKADQHQIHKAVTFIRSLKAGGGTEMMPALQTALYAPPKSDLLRQIVFITDGSVANEDSLLALIHRHLGNARLFTVAIGAAPNRYFMRKAAEFGRGRFVSVADFTQIQSTIDQLFLSLSAPLIRDIQITWPQEAKVEAYPSQVPDLYQGESITVYAKLSNASAITHSSIMVSGSLSGSDWQQTIEVKNIARSTSAPRRWAREKIDQLLDEKIKGAAEDTIRQQVLPLALEHQLLSPYTSFVAVEKQIVRPDYQPLVQQQVANAVPAGHMSQSVQVAIPKTATRLEYSLAIAFASALLALIALYGYRRCDR